MQNWAVGRAKTEGAISTISKEDRWTAQDTWTAAAAPQAEKHVARLSEARVSWIPAVHFK